MILEEMEMVYFLFAKRKMQPNYLILLQCFAISTAGFPIRTDIFLFLMVKFLPELLEVKWEEGK